jgi:hypothetical protein
MKINRGRKFSGADRRQSHRLKPSDVPFLRSVSFNQGSEVHVLNISRGGMLLETDVRLRPRTRILVQLTTNRGIFETAGNVLRCAIVSLKEGPTYRSAISFENPFHLMDGIGANTAEQYQNAKSMATADRDESILRSQPATPCDKTEQDIAILTVVANDACDATFYQDLMQNNW